MEWGGIVVDVWVGASEGGVEFFCFLLKTFLWMPLSFLTCGHTQLLLSKYIASHAPCPLDKPHPLSVHTICSCIHCLQYLFLCSAVDTLPSITILIGGGALEEQWEGEEHSKKESIR